MSPQCFKERKGDPQPEDLHRELAPVEERTRSVFRPGDIYCDSRQTARLEAEDDRLASLRGAAQVLRLFKGTEIRSHPFGSRLEKLLQWLGLQRRNAGVPSASPQEE